MYTLFPPKHMVCPLWSIANEIAGSTDGLISLVVLGIRMCTKCGGKSRRNFYKCPMEREDDGHFPITAMDIPARPSQHWHNHPVLVRPCPSCRTVLRSNPCYPPFSSFPPRRPPLRCVASSFSLVRPALRSGSIAAAASCAGDRLPPTTTASPISPVLRPGPFIVLSALFCALLTPKYIVKPAA